jgi:LysR family transcriptional regulator for bpeEF and oprC
MVTNTSSFRSLLAFSEAAKRGSFAAAARELGLSPSAIVKSVARLERDLCIRLFHRNTRSIRLTYEGEALLERCLKVLDELAALQTTAVDSRGVCGVLRLDIPVAYGRQFLLPAISRLAKQYPALGFDIRFSDTYNDVIAGGFDAAVRIGRWADSRLIARVFDFERLGVYASPAYLARRAPPRACSELDAHDCIGYRLPNTGRPRAWQFRVDGRPLELSPRVKYLISDREGLVAAASQGLGLVQAPCHMAKAALAAGELTEMLSPFEPAPLPIAVVFASKRDVPMRLRVFIDAVSTRNRAREAESRVECLGA